MSQPIKNTIKYLFVSFVIMSSANLLHAKDATSDELLQMGHEKKNAGDLGAAIELYEKALKANPKDSAAERSLKEAVQVKAILDFAKNFPKGCQMASQNFKQIFECAQKHFIVNGKPINPLIVEALESWPSDRGDQIVAIDLLNSQDSNRFSLNGYRLEKYKNYFSVQHEGPDVEGSRDFTYKVEGVTDNGIFVVKTVNAGKDGSGVFVNLLFLRMREDRGLSDIKEGKLVLNRKRILIEKLGSYDIGDRVSSDVKIEGNTVAVNTEERSGEKATTKFTISLEEK